MRKWTDDWENMPSRHSIAVDGKVVAYVPCLKNRGKCSDWTEFIVDALNEKEHDDATQLKGQALIDSIQAVIDEKNRLLADIDARLANAVRRSNQ